MFFWNSLAFSMIQQMLAILSLVNVFYILYFLYIIFLYIINFLCVCEVVDGVPILFGVISTWV